MVSVRDRALVGKHDTIGRAYICLDPRRYGDFLTHDLWLDLDTQGRILLRISMEGEKDDPQFYFGRAFRSLKRAESDMVRVFIDQKNFDLCVSAANHITSIGKLNQLVLILLSYLLTPSIVSVYLEHFCIKRCSVFLSYYIFSAGIMHMTSS